jgi:quinol monooxygenase YgiN
MELVIFARFHSRPGQEQALANALREQVGPVSAEPGCIEIGAYASTRDPRLFFIHSRWADGASFEVHATLRNTLHFIEVAEGLTDQPVEVIRAQKIV